MWLIDETLTGTTTRESGPGSNVNERWLHARHRLKVGVLPADSV